MEALRAHARGGPQNIAHESAPKPNAGTGDVVVEVRAASYTPGELAWPSTWIDRSGHDRTPTIPCHEVSGVVTIVGFGASGFQVGDEVYGLTDWYRDGAAAELVAVEARNLALRPQSVDDVASSTLPVAGLAAWQALFRHGRLERGQTVLVLGAGGGVGALAVQMAHHAGAQVIGIGRARDQTRVIAAGASTFVDIDDSPLPNFDTTSLVFDTVGAELATSVQGHLGPSARMVSIVDGLVVGTMGNRGTFFVVEPDREGLTKIATMVDQGVLSPAVGRCSTMSEAPELIRDKEKGLVQGKASILLG